MPEAKVPKRSSGCLNRSEIIKMIADLSSSRTGITNKTDNGTLLMMITLSACLLKKYELLWGVPIRVEQDLGRHYLG